MECLPGCMGFNMEKVLNSASPSYLFEEQALLKAFQMSYSSVLDVVRYQV